MNQIAAAYPPMVNPFKGIVVPGATGGLVNPFSAGLTLGSIITVLIPYLFGFVGMLLLVYLIIGGLQLMLSRGDPKAIQGAQAKITNALLGFFIVSLAAAIVGFLGMVLGIPVFGLIFK